MNRSEAAMLLTVAASFDRRTIADEDAIAWAAALSDIDFGQARDAVVTHYRETRDWVMPSDILRRVRGVRRDNILNAPAVTPPAVLADDPGREQEWTRLYRWRMGAGDDPETAQAFACERMGVPMDTTPRVASPGRLRAILGAARMREVDDAEG